MSYSVPDAILGRRAICTLPEARIDGRKAERVVSDNAKVPVNIEEAQGTLVSMTSARYGVINSEPSLSLVLRKLRLASVTATCSNGMRLSVIAQPAR